MAFGTLSIQESVLIVIRWMADCADNGQHLHDEMIRRNVPD